MWKKFYNMYFVKVHLMWTMWNNFYNFSSLWSFIFFFANFSLLAKVSKWVKITQLATLNSLKVLTNQFYIWILDSTLCNLGTSLAGYEPQGLVIHFKGDPGTNGASPLSCARLWSWTGRSVCVNIHYLNYYFHLHVCVSIWHTVSCVRHTSALYHVNSSSGLRITKC